MNTALILIFFGYFYAHGERFNLHTAYYFFYINKKYILI